MGIYESSEEVLAASDNPDSSVIRGLVRINKRYCNCAIHIYNILIRRLYD